MQDFLNWSFPLGRLFGIPVRVHWTLPFLTLVMVLQQETGIGMAWELGVGAALWFSVLVHELGHCWAARSVGGYASQILMWPLGGLASVDHPGGRREALIVTLGGPLMHLPLAALFSVLLVAQGIPWSWDWLNPLALPPILDSFWTYLTFYAIRIQVILFLFNMLVPAYPLDGGRLVAVLLLSKFNPGLTARMMMVLSAVAALALFVIGEPWIALFVAFETAQLYRFYSLGALDQHPLFARRHWTASAPRRQPPKRRNHLRAVPSPGERRCPDCSRAVSDSALMCGYCEKPLPQARR